MLITFEGIDGSGKSTQIGLLKRRLEADGLDVTVVREPGGTELSEKIRGLLLQRRISIAPFAELLLFSAARSQLVQEVIRPRLADGFVVICDRFTDSTLAYQGGGRGAAPTAWLRQFNAQVTGGLVVDRTYYLAIAPEVARQRALDRAGVAPEDDRMESSGEDFFARVGSAYEALAREEPDRICRIDGESDVSSMEAAIWADLRPILKRNHPAAGW